MRIHTIGGSLLAVAALAGFGWLAAPAPAQDALGAGDALDANPGQHLGGRNIPLPQEDFRARNLLITGDVPGGRGFRGGVGYFADRDFRGGLGSADLHDFRARAFPSRPDMMRLGTVPEAVDMGGQMRAMTEFRRDAPGAAAGWFTDRPEAMRREMMMPDALFVDRFHAMAPVGDTMIDPRTVGLARDSEGRPMVIHSLPLRGIGLSPVEDMLQQPGLTFYDRLRLREQRDADRMMGRPEEQPFDPRFERLDPERWLRDHERDEPDADREREFDPDGQLRRDVLRPTDEWRDGRPDRLRRIDPQEAEQAEHARILERIVRRYLDTGQQAEVHADRRALRRLDETFDDWRERLIRGAEEDEERRSPFELDDLIAEREEAEEVAPLRPDRLPDLPRPERADPDEERRGPTEILDMARLLRHGERVERLSGAEETRFNELMSEAERALREGRYFDAERSFIRALRITPGEPMAMVGMGHAQLGSGLYLSAGLTLRRALALHPELIDARYDGDLLPSRPRLNQVVGELTQRLAEPRDRMAISFLLAYVGHQLEDETLVEQGIEVLRTAAPDDPMTQLLAAVWLGEDPPQDERPEPPGRPSEQPGQPMPEK